MLQNITLPVSVMNPILGKPESGLPNRNNKYMNVYDCCYEDGN